MRIIVSPALPPVCFFQLLARTMVTMSIVNRRSGMLCITVDCSLAFSSFSVMLILELSTPFDLLSSKLTVCCLLCEGHRVCLKECTPLTE